MASWGRSDESTTCLYQVLGVDRDADQPTIRSAYKKLVLQWHPDRNLDNARDAEIRFKEIQTAYDILSNENERAWYDTNHERILKGTSFSSSSGGHEEMEDPCGLDLYQYFSLSCFEGFSDDATGFYFIFASAFAGIGQAEEISVPKFGDSNSSWSRVRKFYAFWDTFCTRRKFRWAAKHNLNDAANRRERGLMKKANAKAMEQCRREWEGNVKRLVKFVKNLDPRVRNHALQTLEDERRHEEDEQLRNQAIFDAMDARRARDLQQEVDRLDQTMEEPEAASTQLACLICRRKFRSQKTLLNHQSSAKHMQRVKRLKAHLQREEQLVFGMNVDEEDDEEDVYEAIPPPPTMNDDVLDDDASSIAAASVVSGFSDFVLIEDLEGDGDGDDDEEDDYSDEDGVQIEFWDETFAVDSDQELELVGVDLLEDGIVRSRATDDVVAPPASGVPDVSMDLLLAQQLASGVGIAGDGDFDRSVLAQVMDPTNLDRLLALQLEQEDLMARRALAANADRDVNAIHSDEDGYDSELDTLVDALNAKMISLDDPNLNVKDLEKRLQRAIARSGSSKSRKSKKKNKKRVRKNRDVRGSNSSDEAEEGISQFMDSFRKGKEVAKTKKELRGDKRKRRRRRRLANDPQSTSRCAVCHRGFASKAKLNRHIEANPSHVTA